MFRNRLLLPCTLLTLALVVDAGQSQTATQDQYGDPLPAGAVARLGTVRWRHDDVIGFAAFLPDGKAVVSVGADRTIRVWEFPSGKEIRRINLGAITDDQMAGLRGGFRGSGDFGAVALSKDGKTIATYFDGSGTTFGGKGLRGEGDQIRLHDVATGKELPALKGDMSDVVTLLFSPTGEQLMSLDGGGAVQVWDWAKAKLLNKIAKPNSSGMYFGSDREVMPVYAPDGNTIMFFGSTNVLQFVDTRAGKQSFGSDGHSVGLQSIKFTPDGKHLVTNASDNSTRKWEAATGKDLGPADLLKMPGVPLKGFGGRNQTVSPDGQVAVRLTNNKAKGIVIAMFDVATGKDLGQIQLDQAGPVQSIAPDLQFSPNGKMLAVSSRQQQKIELYEIGTGKRLQTLGDASDPGKEPVKVKKSARVSQIIIFSPNSKTLASTADHQTMKLWDTTTGQQIGTLVLPGSSPIQYGAFTPDGRCLALDMTVGTVNLYELASAQPRHIFGKKRAGSKDDNPRGIMGFGQGPINSLLAQPSTRLLISPDGKTLAQAGLDRIVHVWDIPNGQELAAFKGHSGELRAIVFAPDCKTVASASADTTALVWDVAKLGRPAPPGKELQPADLEACWVLLAGSDGVKGFAAIRDLTAAPKAAVALLKEKVKPAAPVEMKQIEELIGQLDDTQFKVRDKANSELVKIGERIVPAIDKALTKEPTLEMKRRLEELRAKMSGVLLQGDRLRVFRAVEVLERIGTPEARQVLQVLAEGDPAALVTVSAREALKR